MVIVPQHGSCILETDHALPEREKRRMLAELQAIGFRAVLLPMGVTIGAVATCGLDDDDD